MKKLIIFLLGVVTLASCSTPKELYDKGIQKIEKAIEKDSTLVFPTDTLRVTEYDTILGKDGKDSIIRITERIEIPCDFDMDAFKEQTRNKTRRELRFERKMIKDSLRHIEKMYNLETKRLEDSLAAQIKLNKELTKQIKSNDRKEKRLAKEDTKQKKGGWFARLMGRVWWIFLIIAFAAGIYIRGLIKFPIFKRKPNNSE